MKFCVQKSCLKNQQNSHSEKDKNKNLAKKVSYREIAYNTVEKPLSRNKSDSRGSSNSHRTKNQPKTALNFAFEKDCIEIFFSQ